MDMDFKDILYTKEDGIATVTLNRPQAYNAMTPTMQGELVVAFEDAQRSEEVKVVVLTGAGRTFCAGANPRNLKDRLDSPASVVERRHEMRNSGHRVVHALAKLEKPLIGAINGPAAGGGMDLASMCDIRIASEWAKFRMAYVRMGVVPAEGGVYYLPRIVGLARACELAWTGRSMEADEALRIGYVSRVVPHEELMAETRKLALQIAQGPSVAIQLSKRLIYDCLGFILDQALEATEEAMRVIMSTEDAVEGQRAAVENRGPVFKGEMKEEGAAARNAGRRPLPRY